MGLALIGAVWADHRGAGVKLLRVFALYRTVVRGNGGGFGPSALFPEPDRRGGQKQRGVYRLDLLHALCLVARGA